MYYLLSIIMMVLVISPAQGIIGGKKMNPLIRPEIVKIHVNHSSACATIVGPRVILTAAHMGKNGERFSIATSGGTYTGRLVRSSLYPKKDHDLAIGILDRAVRIDPASLGEGVQKGQPVMIYGHGFGQVGGGGEQVFRIGEALIEDFSGFDFVSIGAGVNFGDSGGPAYSIVDGNYYLEGIATKGNVQDTNYHVQMAIPETQEFLRTVTDLYDVGICGFNMDCEPLMIEPAPQEIQFKKAIFQYATHVDQKIMIDLSSLLIEGELIKEAITWSLKDAPEWVSLDSQGQILNIFPDKTGQYRFEILAMAGESFDTAEIQITVNDRR